MKEKIEQGVTVYTAQKYHGVYQYDIAYKLSKYHHLSCIMPAAIGLHPLIFNISEIFDNDKRITVVMRDEKEVDLLNDMLIDAYREGDPLFPITVSDFIEQSPETEVYIIFDLYQEDRIAVGNILIPKKKRIVISIGKPELNNNSSSSSKNAYHALSVFKEITMTDTTPHPLVFPVNSILDIRDIMFADTEEKGRITTQLQTVVRHYQYDVSRLEKLEQKKEEEAAAAAKQQLLDELELLKRQLEATRKLNEAITLVSESAGIRKEDLKVAAEKLVDIKRRYETIEDSIDENEIEITRMQNEIATVLSDFSKQRMNAYNRESFENLLIKMLGKDVWNRLNEKSKSFLISARMNYEAMVSSLDADSIDYSGVCLQITKVLDEEMADRLYFRYRRYLEKKYSIYDVDKWPAGMVVRKRSGRQELASAEEFTLGSVVFTIGIDGNGRIKNQRDYNEFIRFATAELYKNGMSQRDIRNHVQDLACAVEKVRKDYRNPSAHRNMLSQNTAKECMEYMIDQIKKLKHILEDMKV